MTRHLFFMREALSLADQAASRGEVPVGAVIVLDDRIIGRGFNQPISTNDPTAHAEIIALRDAARTVGNYRLAGARLYVTIEPCLMCVGACVHARLETIAFGANEPKAGAVESRQRVHEHPSLNHRLTIISGVLAHECGQKIAHFFRDKRSVET